MSDSPKPDNDSDRVLAQDHIDGYVNELTGIGSWVKDKTLGGVQGGPAFGLNIITNVNAENRWRGSDLGLRVVEAIPDEMTREGWEISIQPDEEEENKAAEGEPDDTLTTDAFGQQPGTQPQIPLPPEPQVKPLPEFDDEGPKLVEKIDGKLEELGASEALWTALCYERAYGGGAILVGAKDGVTDLTKPLIEDSIKSVDWLNVLQGGLGGEIVAQSYYNSPLDSNYGKPEIYLIRNLVMNTGGMPFSSAKQQAVKSQFYVHESRLLVFDGTPVSRRARLQQTGWGDSIFTRVDEVMSQYGQTWGGVANLMQDFSQGVLKIEGLAKMLGAKRTDGSGGTLSSRALQLNMARSISRLLLIDTTEEFSRETASLAGIADVLQQFALRLAAAADMPVTLLMGQAPGGLNATGDSDVRFFYDRIAAKQRKRLLPQLKRLIKIIMLAKDGPTDGVEPEKWTVKFNPLYQLTELEQATLRKTVMETDIGYINAGVLSPEEVAASAYGGAEWTMERTIDFKGRADMVAQQEKDKEAKQELMSESAKAGVEPAKLALNHPENPLNLPQPDAAKPKE